MIFMRQGDGGGCSVPRHSFYDKQLSFVYVRSNTERQGTAIREREMWSFPWWWIFTVHYMEQPIPFCLPSGFGTWLTGSRSIYLKYNISTNHKDISAIYSSISIVYCDNPWICVPLNHHCWLMFQSMIWKPRPACLGTRWYEVFY